MIGSSNIVYARASGSALPGAAITYRPGNATSCPDCGKSHWHVGRHTAECAWCATALPISTSGMWYRHVDAKAA
ncbi:hypothetical protein FHS96_003310 [Sphingomonas zeicaulis]|uniref:hypothetical protein n=1 Tax=Sphingomonas zeicaulis TaxID=1632740 RepID=UPI003D1AEFCE